MADTAKPKNKFLFVLDEEDGEINESDDSCDNERSAKKTRDSQFIQEWSDRMGEAKEATNFEPEDSAEMDMGSDLEPDPGRIDDQPVAMTITFRDEDFSRKHRGVIESQMVIKFGPELVDSNSQCIFVLASKPSTDILATLVAPLGAISVLFHDGEFRDKYHTYMVDLCHQLFGPSRVTQDSFVIEVVAQELVAFDVDTAGHELRRHDQVLYSKPAEGVLNDTVPKNKARKGRPAADCFNCGGPHSLRDCNRPKNYNIINQNREKFRQNKFKGNTRYHAEVDKLSGMTPGHISDVLQDALGLRSTQLPRHVYRMRRFGYPPGWLEEAKIAHSGVTVYGTQGAVPEDGDEEGEVFEEGEKDKYDIKKIIKFPGFNVAPPESTEEEHETYACPPMATTDDISDMIQRLAPNAYQAYRRKKARAEAANDDDEMQLSLNDSEGVSSSGPSENRSTPNNHHNAVTEHLLPCETTPTRSNLKINLQDQATLSCLENEKRLEGDVATPKRGILGVGLGTPVLPTASPFVALPTRDKFNVNISDVIHFENLPNSTGTYSKVQDSIAKIREFVALNYND